ncbi:MAG: extracellular solute-binding protein [Clostridia bacterium]|nr:extracellular solute-binding protein [Clostridia bacterium]
MKRTLSLVLALLMLAATAMTSCSESTENAETTAGTSVETPVAGEEVVEETEETRATANVPEGTNYDGYTFTIHCSSNSEYGIVQNDFAAEELTGEAINDAKFNRNVAVGDKLNVVITTLTAASAGHDAGFNEVTRDVQAGTASFDLLTACGYTTSKLSMNNYLVDLGSVPYIDLEASWWDQIANKDLKVLDQLFYTTGDITVSDNDATYCVMFNKNLITQYDMENPYEMVENGTWTVDKFMSMAEAVSLDINGDGIFDTNDRYGVLVWDDTMMGVVNCSGEKCATVNNEGLIELTLNTEKTMTILDKFLTFAQNKEIVYAYQRANWSDSLLVTMFSGDQSLFLTQLIQLVPKMREMDSDFGILPYFKYDEAQQNYYTTIGSWHSVFLGVPTGPQDLERTGIITEVLASESYDLTEAYYDKTLKGKTTRDEESSAMLDLIFANRVYDLGWYFQFGGYNEGVMNQFRNYQNAFASAYKTSEKAANKVIQKTNEAFLEAKAAVNP